MKTFKTSLFLQVLHLTKLPLFQDKHSHVVPGATSNPYRGKVSVWITTVIWRTEAVHHAGISCAHCEGRQVALGESPGLVLWLEP